MDVTTLSTSPSFSYHGTGSPAAAETAMLPFRDNSVQQKFEISEKVMMDLKDVQNFLYMMIGSSLILKSNDNTPGSGLDTVA